MGVGLGGVVVKSSCGMGDSVRGTPLKTTATARRSTSSSKGGRERKTEEEGG
jgi:hypothetical protein